MTQRKYLKALLISALICITLGGLMLHLGIHQIFGERARFVNFVPFIAGLISVIIVTAMFLIKKMIPFAYLLNGMLCIIGTVTMAFFSVKGKPYPLIPDIIILFTVFFIGKILFELELTNENTINKPRHKGRFLRYPNLGYWVVHLVSLSVVFSLGHILWK